MPDADLERFVSALEDHLGLRRGRDHALSPPDFALARRWHAAGITVEDVCAAVDALVAEGRDPTSLALCRRRVEGRASRAPIRDGPAAAVVPDDDGAARPAAVRRALEGLDPRRAGLFPGTRAALDALDSPDDRAGRRRLEEVLGREALAALAPAERAALDRRAERAVARQRGRVSDAALAEARERQLRAGALRALGLDPD